MNAVTTNQSENRINAVTTNKSENRINAVTTNQSGPVLANVYRVFRGHNSCRLLMTKPTCCYVVLMTPPGRGAVASLLVDGVGAAAQVDRLFQAASQCAAARMKKQRIYFGRWRVSHAAEEEVVVCRRDVEQFEVHCHGGQAAAQAIALSLVEAGCRQLDWQSWLRRSNHDPIRAEARRALAEAQTERAARILLEQFGGLLRQAVQRVVDQLPFSQGDTALAPIEELLQWSHLGLHLSQPWRVVLAGPANVGKSSLINALVGYRRAIVHDQPGTTRDTVSATTAFSGWPIELTDTAGLRDPSDDVETAGIAKTLDQLERADLVVLVLDATGVRSHDCVLLTEKHPHALVVHNKCDLIQKPVPGPLRGLLTSAITGDGVSRLRDRITAKLVPIEPPPGTPIPFTCGQIEALLACREAILGGNWREAQSLLQPFLTSNDRAASD